MEPQGRDFHHPFQPYGIQNELMNAIYDCITEGQIGIFESPTGGDVIYSWNAFTARCDYGQPCFEQKKLTFGQGKSLSLICGSLTWLRDFQEKALEQDKGLDEEEPGWVLEHDRNQRRNAVIEQRSEFEARLSRIRAKELRQKQRYEDGEPRSKRIKTDDVEKGSSIEDDARFLLKDYNSEDDNMQATAASNPNKTESLSAATLKLLERLGTIEKPSSEKDDIEPVDEIKVFYCSRTHSQLTQFVDEVRRVNLPTVSWASTADGPSIKDTDDQVVIKHLSLGARKNLCINADVTKLGSAAAINERCLDLQQPSTPKEHKCPFIPNKENETLVNEFRDYTLAQIRDIEDIGILGKRIGICPYYAARSVIKPSEIITLPYPLLLQESARKALDIFLKGHVVIIDEAHNLMDAISNIHSVTITQAQLKRCRAQLGIYLQKFRNRLKGKNRVYVTQVVRLLDSLSGFLEEKGSSRRESEGAVNVTDLMSGKGVDQINLYKLMRYLVDSKLARKVEGYIAHTEEHGPVAPSKLHMSISPVLTHVQSFLQVLTNPASEGRFFYEKSDSGDVSLKYMLLDPTHHFKGVVEEARAVILAGGTMSPMDDYIRHLFAYVKPDRLKTWSCGHIIPNENLIVWPVAKGPEDIDFDFTYEKRNLVAIVDALGYCVIELSGAIPDGLVVFFPSYSYLNQVVLRWELKMSGVSLSIWDRLTKKKPIFRESKEVTGVDDILHQYSQSIGAGKGGLLLSVIGGKMSEGINFSDKLGRGVVVVGLPFPNIQSAQWKAKLEYIEKSAIDRGGSRNDGKAAARSFYENACMRAVNQSIGRVIRHQKDFASIILLDRRYTTPRIADKLPGWIKQGLVQSKREASFQDVVGSLQKFFGDKGGS